MAIYELKKNQLAGFDIIGYRQEDGEIVLGDLKNGDKLPDFPEEIHTPYGIFTLEFIRINDKDGKLPENHPGKKIEWGIYV